MADKKPMNKKGKPEGKMYDISLDPGKVKAASISRYKNGYSYATMTFAPAEKEYMSINYEWEGDSIPEFAMSVMEIMKTLSKEKASLDADNKEAAEYFERAAELFAGKAQIIKTRPESEEE